MRHFDKNEGQMRGNSRSGMRLDQAVRLLSLSIALSSVWSRIALLCYLLDVVDEVLCAEALPATKPSARTLDAD